MGPGLGGHFLSGSQACFQEEASTSVVFSIETLRGVGGRGDGWRRFGRPEFVEVDGRRCKACSKRWALFGGACAVFHLAGYSPIWMWKRCEFKTKSVRSSTLPIYIHELV